MITLVWVHKIIITASRCFSVLSRNMWIHKLGLHYPIIRIRIVYWIVYWIFRHCGTVNLTQNLHFEIKKEPNLHFEITKNPIIKSIEFSGVVPPNSSLICVDGWNLLHPIYWDQFPSPSILCKVAVIAQRTCEKRTRLMNKRSYSFFVPWQH